MVKRVGQKKRGKYSRKPKKIILIGTEGNNQTEKNYFTAFNQTQSEYKINVAKGNNTDPEGVIRDLLKTAKQEELDLKQGDILACFIDVDFKQGREKELRAAIKWPDKIMFLFICQIHVLKSGIFFILDTVLNHIVRMMKLLEI